MAMDYLTQQNRRVAESLPYQSPLSQGRVPFAGALLGRGAEGVITAKNKRVVILGGGDTSADCLGNVHREGAASVQVLTHGPRPPDSPGPLEWPDWPFILRTYPAHEEGGDREWSVVVTGFSGENGCVERMHAIEAVRQNGHTQTIPETEREIDADLVLLAIGFDGPVRDRLLHDLDVRFAENGAIACDDRYRTSVQGVFTAGDARRGASLIVWAIAEGRKAAREIDQHIMGKSLLPA
jgi:glutamate synthase (NADPH/NADH) small chain